MPINGMLIRQPPPAEDSDVRKAFVNLKPKKDQL